MRTRKLVTLGLIWALAFTQTSCGQKQFTPLSKISEVGGQPGGVFADFCTLDPSLVNQQLKIFFSIDISGSNAIAAGGRPPTDPTRSRRYDSLIRWLDQRVGSPNEFYTMLEFSENSGTIPASLNTYDPVYNPFTNDKDFFRSVVEQQKGATTDAGGTPYKAAITTIINTIKADAIKAKERADKGEPAIQSNYVVIHISDGVPTDTNETEIVGMIKNDLMQLPNDPQFGAFINQITLNTGYYYVDVDLPDARHILEEMAKAGKGEAYSFDTGDIDYDKLTDVIIKKVTTSLTDVIVNNLNMVWDMNDKNLLLDSDADFLSDKMERALGSDPHKRDSDDNGVGDGIEAIINSKGLPCRDKKCDPARANTFNGCFDPITHELLDKDEDGLSDCEERALGTDPERVDTNGNGIPDYLDVKFSIPATKEPNGVSTPPADTVDSDFDGVYNLPEVKFNTPPRMDNSTIRNLKPYKYKISQTSFNPYTGVACYDLGVKDVSFANPDDMIRIYLMENENNQTGRKLYRIIDRPAKAFNLNLGKAILQILRLETNYLTLDVR